MRTASSNHVRRLIGAAIGIGVGIAGPVVSTAVAGWTEMSARLPAQANAIIAINIDAVMASPLAQQEGWADKWADRFEAGPVAIVPGTHRVLSGAMLSKNLRDADWQITQMELGQPMLLEDVARSEGGYVDKVWDKMAVVTSENYFISLDPTTLASTAPADHQRTAKWLRTTAQAKGLESERLNAIVAGLGARTQIVMALDVEDAYSATQIRRNIEMTPVPNLNPKADLDVLAHTLASAKGITFTATVTDKINATLSVDLGLGADAFVSNAAVVASEILNRSGLDLPELSEWKAAANGNTVTLSGPISKESMSNVLALTGLRSATKVDPLSADPAVIGPNSRKFYRTVSAALDSYPKGAGYPQVVTWATRQARVLERLPLINVDPELVEWSAEVSQRLREIALSTATDMQSNQAAKLGVASAANRVGGGGGGYGYGYGGYSGYYGYNGSDRGGWGYNGNGAAAVAARQQVDQERAQLQKQNYAKTLQNIGQTMDGLGAKRNALRASLVQKYGIEF